MRGAENKQTSRDDIRRDGTPSIESLTRMNLLLMSGASGRVESGSGERGERRVPEVLYIQYIQIQYPIHGGMKYPMYPGVGGLFWRTADGTRLRSAGTAVGGWFLSSILSLHFHLFPSECWTPFVINLSARISNLDRSRCPCLRTRPWSKRMEI